jgi:hypothetical protein
MMAYTQYIFNCARNLLMVVTFAVPMAGHAETPKPVTGKPFSSMAIAPDGVEESRVPRPPVDLAENAYLRNGYRAILRILIAEDWAKNRQEAEDCSCQLDQFTWDMALENLERFQTSDNPRLPFKVLDLYAMADALEAVRAQVCTE